MKMSTLVVGAVAAPAIATSVCLLSAAAAGATTEDAGASSVSKSADTSDPSTPPSSPGSDADDPGAITGDDDADPPSDVGADLDADDDESGGAADFNPDDDGGESIPAGEAAGSGDADADADADQSGPESVPNSARRYASESLVTLDTVVDEEPEADTVDLALQQIAQARDELYSATWDSGLILAGLAAMLPQMYMSGATTSLERWEHDHARLQEEFAATVDNPFAHWIAGLRIENSIQRTIRVQRQLDAAEDWLPVVGWFGPRDAMAAIAELVDKAADNGLVYQILDLYMENVDGVRHVNPIMRMSVNGGEYVDVLLDTGSLGLVIDPQLIGLKNIGAPFDHGTGCYGDCSVEYAWDAYNIPVAVNGIESSPTPVLVVTLDTWYALSETNGAYDGILGIGANNPYPFPSNPLTALPGLLNQGVLIQERRRRAILGPNPYSARVTLDGAPIIRDLVVQVGDHDRWLVETWIDSGGIFGTVPKNVVGGDDSVPAGTPIAVYTEDGETLLFAYTTTQANKPDVVPGGPVIMGFPPFQAASIYVDFRGSGKTIFNHA